MRQWVRVSLAVALAIASATPIDLFAQAPDIDIDTSRVDAAVRDRAEAAARIALVNYIEWLGPPPFRRLSIGDQPSDLVVSVPLWDSPAAMTTEWLVASGIAGLWLSNITGNEQWKRGAAEYLQSRVVERLFDNAFLIRAYSYDASCLFGGHVRWPHRSLPLSRWQLLADPMARAFGSLERELGWPTLQGALRAAVVAGGGDPVGTMSAATGRDLAPVFAAATDNVTIDHAVTSLASAGTGTQVSIASNGPIPFPLLLRVEFEDGQRLDLAWQGRERVSIESPARAVAARLDPDRVLLLDGNPFNNAIVQPRASNVPVMKWMARWIAWLQDALLTQTFPV